MSTLTLQPDATAGKDAGIMADNATTNYGTSNEIHVIMTGGGVPRRALLQFDLSSIPAGSTVVSAVLTLTAFANRLSADTLAVHRVTQAWTEAGVTYNKYDGTTSWGTAGGDYDATADATFVAPATTGATVDVAIASLVQEWVNGATNNGMIMKVETETGTSKGGQISSSDHATAGYRPKLVVTYTLPSGFFHISV